MRCHVRQGVNIENACTPEDKKVSKISQKYHKISSSLHYYISKDMCTSTEVYN